MKVKELIKLLVNVNPNAEVTKDSINGQKC